MALSQRVLLFTVGLPRETERRVVLCYEMLGSVVAVIETAQVIGTKQGQDALSFFHCRGLVCDPPPLPPPLIPVFCLGWNGL